MKILLKFTGILLIVAFVGGTIYINLNADSHLTAQKDPEDIIIGTWDGLKPDNEGVVWTFKDNGTIKISGDGNHRSYKLIYGATRTQCQEIGMTASSGIYDSNQLVLIITPSNGPNACYLVSYLDYKKELDEILMSLWYAPNGNHLAFQKR